MGSLSKNDYVEERFNFLNGGEIGMSHSMKSLSALEMAAAVILAKQVSPNDSQALIEQLKSAEVSSRDFTGIGFYTEFSVSRKLPPAVVTVSPGGWVRSEVGADRYQLEFMLYVKDGYAEMIEAYSHYDGYGDLDILTASFTEPTAIDPDMPKVR